MHNRLEDFTNYYESFLSSAEADKLFDHLMGLRKLTSMLELRLPTGEKTNLNFGKMMFLDKELIDKNTFPESKWGNTMEWSKDILSLKKRIENHAGIEFKTCVCIYYPDGNSGVDYHSDPDSFGDTSIIPSISLGEERPFNLREKKSKKEHTMILKHGSLLVMEEGCQDHYDHGLPIDPSYKKPRINLTFRMYGYGKKK